MVDEEGARHAQRIPDNAAKTEAAEDGGLEAASPDLPVEDVTKAALAETEFTIEAGRRITEAWQIAIAPAFKEPPCLLFRSHVDERDLRSCRFDRRAAGFHRGERLTTEGSAVVAQEDRQHRLAVRQLVQTLTVLVEDGVDGLQDQLLSETGVPVGGPPRITVVENPV